MTTFGRPAVVNGQLMAMSHLAVGVHRLDETRIGDTIRTKLPDDLLEVYPGQPRSTIVGMRGRMADIYA